MTKDLTNARDKELQKRFDEFLESGVNWHYYNWSAVIKLVAKQSAPRFYITPKIAERYVLNYKRGVFLRKSRNGMAMIRDLAENYERIVADNPDMKQGAVWIELVNRPAKSFYMNERTIRDIVYGYQRKNRNKTND